MAPTKRTALIKGNIPGPTDLSRLEKELRGTTEDGKTYVSAAYLGFSTGMQGPVFIRKEHLQPTRNTQDLSQNQEPQSTGGRKTTALDRLIHGPVHQQVTRFNLKGITLKSEPSSTITGQDVIPHYLVTSKANLVMLKELVSGKPLEEFLTTPAERKRYDLYVDNLINKLKNGGSIGPFSFITPPTVPDLSPDSNLSGRLQDDAKSPGPNNRPLSEVTCSPRLLVRNHESHNSAGFLFHAALTDAFEYPPELIRLLKELALQYPNDLLPLRVMLLATHLWFDIIEHPDLQMEWFMSSKEEDSKPYNKLPEVSLAEFIIYFSHWLSWTESMGLSEHPHPFHFIFKACESDHAYAGLGVNMDHIDQAKVIALMYKVTSRIPNMDAATRVALLPCQMPGTKMPPMYHSSLPKPHWISLALTGLPHLGYLGMVNYKRPDLRDLDRPLRELTQNPDKRFRTKQLPYFVNPSLFVNFGTRLPMPSDLSQGIRTSFLQILPYSKPNTARNDVEPSFPPSVPTSQWTITPPGWFYDLRAYVPPYVLSLLAGFARRHYEKVELLGFADFKDSVFELNHNLLWTPRGMSPLTPEDMSTPAPCVLYGPLAVQRSPTPSTIHFRSATPGPSTRSATIPPTPEPQVPQESALYAPLLECWSKVPEHAHWAWKHVLQQLKDLPEEERQEETLATLISTAQTQHNRDDGILNERLASMYALKDLSDDDLYQVLPTSFGRFIGLPPPKEQVVDVWIEHFLVIAEQTKPLNDISLILVYLRVAKARPSSIPILLPRIRRTFQELMDFLKPIHTKEWLGSQWHFLFPGATPTDDSASNCA